MLHLRSFCGVLFIVQLFAEFCNLFLRFVSGFEKSGAAFFLKRRAFSDFYAGG